jgi:XTP/dITP diphosphohydrolase
VLNVVRGFVQGQLLDSASGTNGFGYDPLFYYPPFERSFAELDGPRKFAVSHRGMAVRLVLAWLTAHSQTADFR